MSDLFSPRCFAKILCSVPAAKAQLCGGADYPGIRGKVLFYPAQCGVFVYARVTGLPGGRDKRQFYGFHIHEGGSCAQGFEKPGGHYNPDMAKHPLHKGDLPPLAGFDGQAVTAFFVGGVTAAELIGRTVVIHLMPDDMKSQPSGNSGEKIACGEICAAR